MRRIVVATTSPLKLKIIKSIFPESQYEIKSVNCDLLGLPPQPFLSTSKCAKSRLDYIKRLNQDADYLIAIENGIELREDYKFIYVDVCSVIIEEKGLLANSVGAIKFYIPTYVINKCKNYSNVNIEELSIRGFSKTVGEILYDENENVDPKNWMKTYHRRTREEQIESSLKGALNVLETKKLLVERLSLKYQDCDVESEDDQKLLLGLICSQYQYNNVNNIVLHEDCEYLRTTFTTYCNNHGFNIVDKDAEINDKYIFVRNNGNKNILLRHVSHN